MERCTATKSNQLKPLYDKWCSWTNHRDNIMVYWKLINLEEVLWLYWDWLFHPPFAKIIILENIFSVHLVLRHEMKYLLLATFNGLNGILVEQNYRWYYHHLSPFIDFLRGDRFSPVWLGVLVNPKIKSRYIVFFKSNRQCSILCHSFQSQEERVVTQRTV